MSSMLLLATTSCGEFLYDHYKNRINKIIIFLLILLLVALTRAISDVPSHSNFLNNSVLTTNLDQAAIKKNMPSSSSTSTSTSTAATTTAPIHMDMDKHKTSMVQDNTQSQTLVDHDREQKIRLLMQQEAGYDIYNASNKKKRLNYMAWDDYFMAVSFLSAQRSKDPHEQKGACIVDEDNRIVGIGYNGFPRGCSDDCLPWASREKDGNILHTKEPFLCHAEINAILNKCSSDVKGTRMYVFEIPDHVATKTIIQAGIREIIYVKDPDHSESTRASRIMLQMSGVKTRQYIPNPIAPLNFTDFADEVNTSHGSVEDATVHSSVATSQDDSPSISKNYRDLWIQEASWDPMESKVKKRQNYLSWDDYFTAVAFLSARRSKDPNTQVGACIVDENKCIVGIGYNGFPRGCSDDYLPWARVADSELHKKYPYVVHAEVNAILNKGSKDVKGASLYVALFPCCECAKIIIQAGIREVVYLSDVYHNTDSCRASRIMFEMAGVKCRCYIPSQKVIDIGIGMN